MRPCSASIRDVESWLELATQVESLFGPMPGFEQVLVRNIDRETTLVVRGADGTVVGGLLFALTSDALLINWLAVAHSVRRRGIGASLVRAAVQRAGKGGEVRVITFGADVEGGRAGRDLYASCGFVAGPYLPHGPENGSRQLFTLRVTADE